MAPRTLLGAPSPVSSRPWNGPSAVGANVTKMLQTATTSTRGMLAGQLFVWPNPPATLTETGSGGSPPGTRH